jgi:hypothetical protein
MLLRADEARIQGVIHRSRKSINEGHLSKSVLGGVENSLDNSYHDLSAPVLRRVGIAPLFTSEKKDTTKIRELLNHKPGETAASLVSLKSSSL